MRKMSWAWLTAALVLVMAVPVWAMDFSAQVVRSQGSQEATAQVNVKEGRLRLEPLAPIQPGAPKAYYIYRQDKGVSWLVYPEMKIYYEAPLQPGMDLSRPPLAGEKLPGEMQRTDLGTETVEGVATRKYEITFQHEGQVQVIWYWYAEALKLPIKTGAPDGSWGVTYRQVKMAPQADKLFELPAGFTKTEYPTQGQPTRR
jgi:hypothetical protein